MKSIKTELVREYQNDSFTEVLTTFNTISQALEALRDEQEAHRDPTPDPLLHYLHCSSPPVGKVCKQGNGEPFVLMVNGSVAVCGGNSSARVFDYENQVEYQLEEGPCVLMLEWQDQQWARAVCDRQLMAFPARAEVPRV